MSRPGTARSLFDSIVEAGGGTEASGAALRLIGVDEAGYGPNLGPLVIVATDWIVPPSCSAEVLYETLSAGIARTSREARDGRLLVADSKSVHQPSAGIGRLELVAWTLLQAAGIRAVSYHQLIRQTTRSPGQALRQVPWYAEDCPLPLAAPLDVVEQSAGRLSETLRDAGVALRGICADFVPAVDFNRELESCGTKGRLLSERTLALVRRTVGDCADFRVECVCDKHGGRNRYEALLAACFQTASVICRRETLRESEYELGRIRIRFCCRAERFLPVAAASIVAKYLREVAMHVFNRYWQRAVRDLKPTKGYPVDAVRFRKAVAQAARDAGIDEHMLWRRR